MVESRPQNAAIPDSLIKRASVVLFLLPVGLLAIYLGGWAYCSLIIIFLGFAVIEYCALFHEVGFKPWKLLAIAATLGITIERALTGLNGGFGVLSLSILLAMVYHLIAFDRGRDQAGTDFSVTVSAFLYVGWIGAYLISLRMLPDGMWWVLIALPATWLADIAAYLVGVRIGRHKMTARLSPKKSWEGYLAGILFSVPATVLLTMLWLRLGAGEAITPLRSAFLAAVLSSATILGDLGESMIKRQAGMKDSGRLLPGHGGAFDRIDSWLWGGIIGYYLIAWFFY